MKVCDISAWQEWTEKDWQYLKDEGFEGVIIRLGIWDQLDDWFVTHVNNAVKYGFKYGLYYYAHACTEAEAVREADTVASWIKTYLRGETPELGIWYDVENRRMLAGEDLTKVCMAFLNQLTNYGHQYEGIYASWNWLSKEGEHHIHIEELPDYVPIWVAQYNSHDDLCDEYPGRVRIWQYTDSYNDRNLDADVYYN